MFEALRGLRDAIAPESGSLGSNGAATTNQSNSNHQTSVSSRVEDDHRLVQQLVDNVFEKSSIIDQMLSCSSSSTNSNHPIENEIESLQQPPVSETTTTNNKTSDDTTSDNENKNTKNPKYVLPGLYNRTRDEQMKYIEVLIQQNNDVIKELQLVYNEAKQQQETCRQYILLQSNQFI